MNAMKHTAHRHLVLLTVLVACRAKVDPTRAAFERGMQAYLEKRGDLCVNRPRWPIDVPPETTGTADAVQLPVLEQLGLVTSSMIQLREAGAVTPFQARRYRLTSAGHQLFHPQRADLCFAKLTLDEVTHWEIEKQGAASTALVSYTYHADAPAVVRDPRLGRVFPAVARVLAGTGHAELVEGFTLTPGGWTANELLPREPGAAGVQAAAR
jgi:hypothetical protein